VQLVEDGAVLSLWCTFVVWLGGWIRMKALEGAATRRALPPLEGSICNHEPSARLADGAAIRVDRALTVTVTSMTVTRRAPPAAIRVEPAGGGTLTVTVTLMTVMRRAPPAASLTVDPAGGGTRVTLMTVQLRGAPPAASLTVEPAGGGTRATIRVDRALAAQSPVPLRSVSAELAGSSSLLAGSPSRPRDSRMTRTRGGGEPEEDGVSRPALHSSVRVDRRLCRRLRSRRCVSEKRRARRASCLCRSLMLCRAMDTWARKRGVARRRLGLFPLTTLPLIRASLTGGFCRRPRSRRCVSESAGLH
jgi:hypothetical protein